MNRIAFVGSRGFSDVERARNVILTLHDKIGDFICVSGGAIGADAICADLCESITNIPAVIYKPDWKKYGKRAGFLRNETIVENSDALIAFWDMKSRGTKHSINLAKESGIPHIVIDISD